MDWETRGSQVILEDESRLKCESGSDKYRLVQGSKRGLQAPSWQAPSSLVGAAGVYLRRKCDSAGAAEAVGEGRRRRWQRPGQIDENVRVAVVFPPGAG